MNDSVLVDIVDGVATVTLNEPDKRNAISLDMVDGISATFDALEADESVGAIVVTGAPPAFCAGADLSHLGASREEGLRHIYEAFLRLSRCPLPTLAAVNGAAVGAGLNMALSCDVRLAAAQTMAAKAASAPRELAQRVKATIADMATIDDHAAAVERELTDQLWSMDQPAFAERLAAIQARISGK